MTRQEGGNGYVPGEKVTLTNEVGMADVLDNVTNKVIAKYPAIKLSNNAWFTPSIEPTLQHLLLKYYSKKYGVTIFHVANGSENRIYRP